MPFEITLRRVEDQRSELDRMQRELDSRAALLAKAEEQRDQSRESFKQAYASMRVHEGTIAQLR